VQEVGSPAKKALVNFMQNTKHNKKSKWEDP
jgi:hypothetical protein